MDTERATNQVAVVSCPASKKATASSHTCSLLVICRRNVGMDNGVCAEYDGGELQRRHTSEPSCTIPVLVLDLLWHLHAEQEKISFFERCCAIYLFILRQLSGKERAETLSGT